MSEIDDWVGVPIEEFVDTLHQNAKSFDAIWSDPDLVSKYPQKWVAAFEGKIQIVEDNLDSLLRSLDESNVPRGHAVIEYVEVNPRTLIVNVERRLQDISRTTLYSRMGAPPTSISTRNDLVSGRHGR
ncbi:MAG: hypothetical protein OXG15_03120 [Gammaproteobacteria bacterium]|nr:hypothetical protein [Gammaproteobacteria bacterium]